MTARTQSITNLVLALAVPAMGLAYLVSGVSLSPGPFTVAIMILLGTLWFAATAVWNTIVRPQQEIAIRSLRTTTEGTPARRPALVRPDYVVDVSRPAAPWRWTSVPRTACELLAVVWSVPLVALLMMVPVGLVVAGALWLGRLILRP